MIRWLDFGAWDRWLPLGVVAFFVAVGIFVFVAGVTFGIPSGDVERLSRIYTEIGVQTTAGIFAIIVSLSLVAIQFAAQEYSHRIMEYYIRSTIFWTTMVVYLSVMIVGILLQAQAAEDSGVRGASVVVVGSILALVLLVPHFLVTAAYLKPEFIVRKLTKRIDARYLRLVERRGQMEPSADRLLPIIEIMERSIDRGDLTTTRAALEQVFASYKTYGLACASETVDRYYLDGLLRAGRKAIAQNDELQAAVTAVRIVGELGVQRSPAMVIDALEELGFGALRRDNEVAVNEMVEALRRISEAHHDVSLRAAILDIFEELATRLIAADQQRLLRRLIRHVAQTSEQEDGEQDGALTDRIVGLLEEVGHDAAVARMSPPVADVGKALQDLGVRVGRREPGRANGIVLALLRIERVVDRGERGLVASLEFARAEVERASGGGAEQRPAAKAVADATEADPGGLDPADLWGKQET